MVPTTIRRLNKKRRGVAAHTQWEVGGVRTRRQRREKKKKIQEAVVCNDSNNNNNNTEGENK